MIKELKKLIRYMEICYPNKANFEYVHRKLVKIAEEYETPPQQLVNKNNWYYPDDEPWTFYKLIK